MPAECHTQPAGWRSYFFGDYFDCAYAASQGYCRSTEYGAASSDGVLASVACCECGGGGYTSDLVKSCQYPTGASWSESGVECAAAGMRPLADDAFEVERDCGGGACGVSDCCVPAECHAWPAGWRNNDGNDCTGAASQGYCHSTDANAGMSSGGVLASAACCECGGGGSDALYKSCRYPTGTSWRESAVDCAAAGLAPLADDVFETERECGGGACGVSDCCVPAECHTQPAGWRSYFFGDDFDCAYVASQGYCRSTDDDFAMGSGGVYASAACCECGGGTDVLHTSCQYPTGTSWSESAVDCAAAGLAPLADAVFGMERECGGGACGVSDCCVPTGCHAWPGWRSNSGYDCVDAARYGHCRNTDQWAMSSDGVNASAACCECGGGSDALYTSCQYPTGTSWSESAVDCAAAGLAPLADDLFELERECGGGACGVSDCCVPTECHAWPAGWRNNYGWNCATAASQGYCRSTDAGYAMSSDGANASAACCECGGGRS